MAWYDISGPDFWTLSYAENFSGATPTVSWSGTEAQLVFAGPFSFGYGDSNQWVNLVLTPTSLVADAAANINKMRVTLEATFGASPDTTGNDGFLFLNWVGGVGGSKIPDSGSWAQSGVSQVVAVIPDDLPSLAFLTFENPLSFLAGDGIGFAGPAVEAVARSLSITVVSVESDYEISTGSDPRFWTGYQTTQESSL